MRSGTAAPLLREDFDRLRADLLRVEQEVQGTRSTLVNEIQATDRRTVQTLTELQRSMARLGTRLDDLGRETGQLQGRVDELRRRVDTLALQFDAVGTPAAATGTGAVPRPETVAQGPAPPGTQASDLYQTAYIDFTRGHYNLAIAGFREFLRLYPATTSRRTRNTGSASRTSAWRAPSRPAARRTGPSRSSSGRCRSSAGW